jgi:hypothetical protein
MQEIWDKNFLEFREVKEKKKKAKYRNFKKLCVILKMKISPKLLLFILIFKKMLPLKMILNLKEI